MHTNDSNQFSKITIISELLSSEEIRAALEDNHVKLEELKSNEKTRGMDPVVISAIITGFITMVSTVTLIVSRIIERNKVSKPQGLLIIKNTTTEIHIPFNVNSDELERQLQAIKNIGVIEQIYITEKKDEGK